MRFTRYGSLKGRTVIITGGASAIGASFVRAFVENGAKVAFLDLQRETGTALSDSLVECAARPLFVPCDLTDTAALRAALGEIRAALGSAAVLVNNAANDQRYEFDQITPEQFDRTIAVNFRHVFFAAQAIVPQMRDLGYGSIVNMSSVSWMRGIPLLEAYASAKAAIVGFTNTLARALGPHRIRVNAIAPRHRAHRAPAPAVVSDGSAGRGGTRGAMPARLDRAGRHRESRAVPRLRRQPADHQADDLGQRRRALTNPFARKIDQIKV